MIKPGTLCMIRGVPSDHLGHEFNGQIVIAQGIKKMAEEPIYWIEPELFDHQGRMFNGSREQWLYPFKDFDPQELIEQELETQ
jgi:hypothetical protein